MRKIGRNQPCPCGSGRKYKRCCLGMTGAFVSPLTTMNAAGRANWPSGTIDSADPAPELPDGADASANTTEYSVETLGAEGASTRLQDYVNKRYEEEFKRRSALSPAKAMAGIDDFCRLVHARASFESPELVADWNGIRTQSYADFLDHATTSSDYLRFLHTLIGIFPLARGLEAVEHAIVPPSMNHPSQWSDDLQSIGFAPDSASKLVATGFAPMDVGGKPAFAVDCHYGVAFDHAGRSHAVDDGMLRRYAREYPPIRMDPSHIFDIGPMRGQIALQGLFDDPSETPTVRVGSRAALDELLNKIRGSLKSLPKWQLWLRGQPSEYLLPDARPEARAGVCPWRSVQDVSLVPSLYRNVGSRLEDQGEYCRWLLELHRYYLFAKETLGIPSFNTRAAGDTVRELLDDKWGGSRFTVTQSIGDEVVEHHDYHVAYRDLQAALFLQHYGLESNVLDITKDVDVALFFAQHRIVNGAYVPDHDGTRYLYVFLLDPNLDLFIDTSALLESLPLLRPKRQRCGILAGASLVTQNYYSRFIAVRIELTAPISYPAISPEYLFPGPKEDKFLRNLLYLQESQSLKRASPFTLRK